MKRTALLALLLVLGSVPSQAHDVAGITSGFSHPFLGFDHLVVIFSAGAFAMLQRQGAAWEYSCTFILMMALGFAASVGGLALPGAELLIALSIVVFALLIFVRVAPPLWSGMALMAIFAFAHGHAHASSLPAGADPLLYSSGMLAASALIMALGGLAAKGTRVLSDRMKSISH